MKKEDREKIIAAVMSDWFPLLDGNLAVDFRRSSPQDDQSRKLFRATETPIGVKIELRCDPKEPEFENILHRAARAGNEIVAGMTNATEIGERERVA